MGLPFLDVWPWSKKEQEEIAEEFGLAYPGSVAYKDNLEDDSAARPPAGAMIWEGSTEAVTMSQSDLWVESPVSIAKFNPIYGAIVTPVLTGGIPAGLAGAAGKELLRWVRFVIPINGILQDLAWMPAVKEGNYKAAIYDFGEVKPEKYSQRWVSPSLAVPTIKEWTVLHPNMVVSAGQEILAGIVFDNVTAAYVRGLQPGEVGLSIMPPGFVQGRMTEKQPLMCGSGALNFAEPAKELAISAFNETNAPPAILLRVTPLL